MPAPQDLIESLLAHCIEAGESGYRPALEEMCVAHPTAAAELRDRVAHLERLGFLGSPAPTAAKPWLPDQVGGYRLAGLLGRGGMGVVFRGQKNGRDEVAIKIVRPDLLADEQARARFRREALMVSRLQHPGICAVLEVGVDEDLPYVVMPLLRGRTFGAWLREQHPPRQTILDILAGHARALHAAHEAGVVHRDVTPGNLFVTDDGQPIVLDFGLARDTTGELPTLTGSQDLVGTLPYMAPEQIRAASIDRRTDVYALGVVAYEALSGRLPFVAKSRSEVSRLIVSGEPPRLRRLVRDLPRALDRIVHKAMDVDPAHRYATAADFADDLQRFASGEPVLARDVGAVVRARRWIHHHPVAATTILLLCLLVLVAGVLAARLNEGLDRYLRMRDVPIVQDLLREADEELWPAHPEKLERMDRWLEQARAIEARMPRHRAALAELRSKALPMAETLRREGQELDVQRKERDLKGVLLAKAKASEGRAAKRRRSELTQELKHLDAALLPREGAFEAKRWQFAAFEDRFLHQTLAALVRSIEQLAEPGRGPLASVEARRREAATLAVRSLGDEKGNEVARAAAAAWREAAGRVATDPKFAGFVLRPQIGLVPLGPDPESKLEEFAHLPSGEPATRNEQGKLVIGDQTGIVLVLIPGGKFTMGAQKDDPQKPHYDPMAEYNESPVHEVMLEPFLLAKHEMTRGQWLKITGESPSTVELGPQEGGHSITLRNPVENVTWHACVKTLARVGLVLPTEAQWERAARAGTDTPWWTGRDKASIADAANVADACWKVNANAGLAFLPYDEDLNDGYALHAPIGSFRANAFGLWDVIGNVYEWCMDGDGDYSAAPRAGDGYRHLSGTRDRQTRGGFFSGAARYARSAHRNRSRAAEATPGLGCRPSQVITR